MIWLSREIVKRSEEKLIESDKTVKKTKASYERMLKAIDEVEGALVDRGAHPLYRVRKVSGSSQ